MTGSGSGAPGRGDVVAPATARAAIGPLAAILAAGLVFRLIIAYLLPGSGFANDLAAFTAWAANLADQGPFGFYDRPFFHDYTPGYLYVLWLVGLVGQLFGSIGDLIKLPAILADLGIAWLVHAMVLELGASRRRALVGAAIVVANPITWFDSVVWGQVDSFGVLFLLLSVRELWKGRSERSAILAVAAALIKPQLGILAPLVAAVTIRRALVPAGGWGDEEPAEPTGTAWERRTRGPVRILTTALAGFLAAVAISAPFGLWVVTPAAGFPFVDSPLLRQIFSTAAGYPYLTVNAYNPWALLSVGDRGLALNGTWIPDAPMPGGEAFASVLGVPAVVVGSVALLAVIVLTSIVVARRPDRPTILVGLAVLALAFFVVPTRVHERYSFPFFAVAAILAAVSMRWRVAYLVAAVATFANMYVVLTTLYDNPQVEDWLGVGPAIRSWNGVAIVALLHALAFAWCLVQLRDGARGRLADELADASFEGEAGAEAAEGDASRAGVPLPWAAAAPSRAAGRRHPAGSASADEPGAGARVAGRRIPAWYDRPSWSVLGPLEWLRARMAETPIRPDRSALLAREGRGRLDRLDVWLLIVLVVASLFLRTFRLAEPARMHFDEVYHARTAAEFLQKWRYGIDHNIYEWTHPHLAKYAMAAGIVLFAGHDVESSSDLGVPVRDAAIEPRRPDPTGTSQADGERLWVATGSEIVAYDLATRDRVGAWAVAGASAVAVDTTSGAPRLLVGTDAGEVLGLDLGEVEAFRGSAPDQSVAPFPIATVGGAVRQVAAFGDGATFAARLADGTVVTVDAATGAETGRASLAGATDMVAAGSGDAIVATLAEVADPDAVASELAAILGGDAEAYAAQLRATGRDEAVIDAPIGSARTELDAAIADGRLAGIRIDTRPWLAVAAADGISFLAADGATVATADVPAARGLAYVSGVEDGTQLWATTTDDAGKPTITLVGVTGDSASGGPTVMATVPLPGEGTRVAFDRSAELVHVLGTTPDGTGTTVYVIEPHGRSVFADHRLPFVPSAWALDTNADYPVEDRMAILAFSQDGAAASLDVGHYAFAWRLPGVIAGALTTALLFLLARVLFRRRSVAVLAGLFALLDGMFFVQSRIAMNDVYVGMFILAAYALFARLWLEPSGPRWRFWAGMPAIGLLLGLALASKWVAAYAIGALGILILLRSALGRVLLVVGLVGLTAVLGYMAMTVPANQPEAHGNLVFVLIMVALTLAAVVLAVYRPIAWTREELWFAIGAPLVLGLLAALGMLVAGLATRPLPVGPAVPLVLAPVAVALLGPAAAVAFAVGRRLGIGPLAPAARAAVPAPEPPSPPAEGWLRLGSGFGLPVAWLVVCLLAIPLVVYVVSYLPWAAIDNHRLWPGFPPGATGQTLLDLTGEMYRYHNDLTSPHAASSPWWAWPLNLKPVWFYQGSFANGTAAAIYDAGNLVIWWLGIPAMVFATVQAYRRRSLGLALVVVGFLCQWISWSRIDRASFQYHYYTSLPFVVLALGYFVAELWHGASRWTWAAARIAGAVALLGPVILWILRAPLCWFVNVEAANPGSAACVGNPGNLEVTASAGAIAIVVVVTGIVLVRMLASLARPRPDHRSATLADLVPLVATAAVGGIALAVARLLPSDRPLVALPGIVPEIIALIVAVPLGLVAIQVVTARDARRFVVGLVVAAGAWFAILYPNIAALPLPTTIVNAYQGLLPTYIYAFQFPVNRIPRGTTSFADPQFVLFVFALVAAAAVVAYSAWAWRAALADRRTGGGGETGGESGGPAAASGPA